MNPYTTTYRPEPYQCPRSSGVYHAHHEERASTEPTIAEEWSARYAHARDMHVRALVSSAIEIGARIVGIVILAAMVCTVLL